MKTTSKINIKNLDSRYFLLQSTFELVDSKSGFITFFTETKEKFRGRF